MTAFTGRHYVAPFIETLGLKSNMRNIAAISLSIYALLLSYLLVFMVAWDNKGASLWWVKQPTDWLAIALLSITCGYLWLSIIHLFSSRPVKRMVKISLSYLLVIHLVTVVVQAEGEAIYFLGSPALFLVLCVGLLYLIGRKHVALTS